MTKLGAITGSTAWMALALTLLAVALEPVEVKTDAAAPQFAGAVVATAEASKA